MLAKSFDTQQILSLIPVENQINHDINWIAKNRKANRMT